MNHVPDADRDDALIARALHQPDAPAPHDDAGAAEYEEVLSHLPFEEVAPPAGLEERIVAAARAARQPSVPSLPRRRSRSSRGRSWRTWAAPAGAAAAAAAAGVLIVADSSGGPGGGGRAATLVSRPRPETLDALLADPGARSATLVDPQRQTVGRVVLGAGGRGEVYGLALAPLEPGETYWLWLTTGSDRVRVGDLGGSPDAVGFEVDGDVDGVVVSVERAGSAPRRPGATAAEGRFAAG